MKISFSHFVFCFLVNLCLYLVSFPMCFCHFSLVLSFFSLLFFSVMHLSSRLFKMVFIRFIKTFHVLVVPFLLIVSYLHSPVQIHTFTHSHFVFVINKYPLLCFKFISKEQLLSSFLKLFLLSLTFIFKCIIPYSEQGLQFLAFVS